MYKSIVVSCDTYYYVLANDLKIDAISAFMGMLGLGSRTGIDIAGEAAGVLPSRAWKQRRFRQEWYPGETISIGEPDAIGIVLCEHQFGVHHVAAHLPDRRRPGRHHQRT